MQIRGLLFYPWNFERKGAMKLDKITIGGFRNIKKTFIELQSITALVSLNCYGKSNLLQAINFGIVFITNTCDAKKKMMTWKKGIPLNKAMASQDFELELQMQTTINNTSYNVIYGYRFKWFRDDGTGSKIIAE